MKKLLLSLLFLPFAKTGPNNSVEIRKGKWPISLESSGAGYSLIFRNQQEMQQEAYDTVEFTNKAQLIFLDQALTSLQKAGDGTQANFSNYSIKRANKKYEGWWYILKTKYATTDFRQPEADAIVKAIRAF